MDNRLQLIRKSAEDDLDELARMHAEEAGESFLDAYVAILETPLGKSVRKTLDDATAMMTGAPCSATLEDLAKASN
tara:strand:+ start:1591 stop:1818 length:228 start_codon:yes stop_codon:yes gene_type:complete